MGTHPIFESDFDCLTDFVRPKMEYIFDPSVIEKLDLTDLRPLPSNLEMRPLLKSDHQNNFLSILAQLTKVGDISKQEYDARFDQMKNSNCYFVLVVVDESARGTGLGKYLVTVCTRLSQHLGVYKTTLECAPHNVKFYEKIGYKDAGETYMEIRF